MQEVTKYYSIDRRMQEGYIIYVSGPFGDGWRGQVSAVTQNKIQGLWCAWAWNE